jgi:hypothetical protein
MDKNLNSHKGEDRPSAAGCTLAGEREEDVAVREAVLRLQARLSEIHCLLGTEMKAKSRSHGPCKRDSRIAA